MNGRLRSRSFWEAYDRICHNRGRYWWHRRGMVAKFAVIAAGAIEEGRRGP